MRAGQFGTEKEKKMEIEVQKMTITQENIDAAEKVLRDNGIEPDEVCTVLQAIGYTLLDIELYPGC